MYNRIITIMLLVMSLFFPFAAFAETVILKSGKTVEGKIIEETDNYVKLETLEGQSLYFYRNIIASIKSDSGTLNPSVEPGLKTGMMDCSDKGYMVFVPQDVSSVSSVLICLPGSGIKTKQDINNWAFTAGKKGFIVIGLDVDYDRISSFYDVEALYSRLSGILDSLDKEYRTNKKYLYLVGTSAGGMMSIALALHFPGRFVAIGVVSGGRLGYGAQEELRNAKGANLYMVHGESDERIPLGEFQSTRKQLERNGAIIEYNIIPGGRHTLNSNAYKEVVDWLSDLESLVKR
jgi:predicted esterase